MSYQPFHDLFPDVAERETRTITALNHPRLPADDYTLVDAYCNEPGCDCQRVLLNVISRRRKKTEAVITFGWEKRKFYANWFGDDDPEIIDELIGPAFNSASRQSELAPALLEVVSQVLEDKNYVNRLKRHYRMFKEVIDSEDFEADEPDAAPRINIPRNAPCPCGSGKKYKQCCGKN